MPKKIPAPKKIAAKIAPKIAPVAKKTAVRNTAIPKVKTVAARKTIEITSEMIAVRAFEIHASGAGGSETDNWFAAEKQLRSGI